MCVLWLERQPDESTMTKSPTTKVRPSFRFFFACWACRNFTAGKASRASLIRCSRTSSVYLTSGTVEAREVSVNEGWKPRTSWNGERLSTHSLPY
jgi:hypothetical protein